MQRQFKRDQVVYHRTAGQKTISGVDPSPLCTSPYCLTGYGWAPESDLRLQPWPDGLKVRHCFKPDHVVHHVFYGRGTVMKIDCDNSVKDNSRTILVKFDNGEIRQYSAAELSYTPWPAPDHEHAELYRVVFRNTTYQSLAYITNNGKGKVYQVNPNGTRSSSAIGRYSDLDKVVSKL